MNLLSQNRNIKPKSKDEHTPESKKLLAFIKIYREHMKIVEMDPATVIINPGKYLENICHVLEHQISGTYQFEVELYRLRTFYQIINN